jgi:hypothetical protein
MGCGAALLAALTIAGCASPSQPIPEARTSIRTGQQHAWMSPDARVEDLLYVSYQSPNQVNVYSFWRAKLVGTLTGPSNPLGLCVDKAQHVYVTDYFTGNILKYAHGRNRPIETLTEPYIYPTACSIDPTTGNLAVSDDQNGVFVFANAKGTPKLYSYSGFEHYLFIGYDAQGNLFVDGSYANHFALAELRKGGGRLGLVTLNQHIGRAGGLQWDGKYLAICDSGTPPNVIYEFSISGSKGKLAGTTSLTGSYGIDQFWLPKFGSGKINPQSTRVVAADQSAADVAYWKYPVGGNATKTISDKAATPYGVTVSKGRK